MRATIYDWMRQTPEHEQYGRMMYPLSHELVVSHNSYNDFARTVQGLPKGNYMQYLAENKQWMNTYGRSWADMGCLREARVGQRSTGTHVYGGRTRGSLAGIGALRTPSYPRNVVSGFGSLDRPPLPSGYTVHDTPPESQISWIGDWETVPGYWQWTRRRATGPKGTCYIYLSANLGDSFMAVAGGVVGMAAADCKALQKALNSAYLAPKSYTLLKVDGLLGPKTCGALHWYQYEVHGIDSAVISAYTYMNLNLPMRFGQEYANVCTKHYTGDYGEIPGESPEPPTPKPPVALEEPEVEEEIITVRAGMNKYLLIGAVAVLGGSLIAWKFGGKKKGRR